MSKTSGRTHARLLYGGVIVAIAAGGVFSAHGFGPRGARATFGLSQLPWALAEVAIGLACLAVVFRRLSRVSELRLRWPMYAAAASVFCVMWVPPWLAGGFVQDDWRLLAAASIRKVVELRPLTSLQMLDSVDGNFRPLGTVLFFGYMLRWFGPVAHAFTAAPLLMIFLSGAAAFAIVRELGYSSFAAAAASMLFFSRGMLYTVATWAAALGDGLAIFLCGMSALFILKACRSRPIAAASLHGLAWICFLAATLAKQSSFVFPLIVFLLLFVRPGRSTPRSLARRTWTAALGLVCYTAPTVGIFLYARTLMNAASPYPVSFSFAGLTRLLSYVTWYFLVIELPDRIAFGAAVPAVLGAVILAALVYVAWRFRAALGERPRDLVFAALAGVMSLSILIPLQTRAAPYYGCMFAFWISIALGIALTRCWGETGTAPRGLSNACCTIFCAVVFSGFVTVRLEQTGLIPSGGYTWGAFSAQSERSFDEYLRRVLASSPQARMILFQNCRDRGAPAAMALLRAPQVQRILLYDDVTQQFLTNDRQGARPEDDLAGRTDPWTYNWTVPLDRATAQQMLSGGDAVRIPCVDGYYAPLSH